MPMVSSIISAWAGTVDSVSRVNKRNSGKRFISQPQKETLSTLVITHPCK
ncbi:hypothetical protein AL505_110116 [Escherichia coli]|nr:hypothetical protein AL505_110116 [Escherichia coli]